MSARKHKTTEESKRAAGSRRAMLKFIGLFVLLVAIFQTLFVTVLAESSIFESYMVLNARTSAWILNLLGEQVNSDGMALFGHGESSGTSLMVKRGCDGIQPSAIFVAAVFAFPATLKARLIGTVIGVTALLIINLGRIVSLFFISRGDQESFESFHETIWPAGFIFLALAFWMVWVHLMVPVPAPEGPAASE